MCADAIDLNWFNDVTTVGLTAGTSTLDETIDEVQQRLEAIAAQRRPQVAADM